MTIPISTGTGAASVAAEAISGIQYQQIEILGSGGASTLGVNPDGSFKSSIIGTPNVNVAGSVVAFQGTTPWPTTNVGSIVTIQIGSVITTQIGSVITVFKDSSILSVPTGSVITVLQSSSIITTWKDSSILSVPVGSTVTVLQNSSILAVPVGSTIGVLQAPSIVGTYAEDAGHTSGDKGIFALAVRNDTLASITSTDADYSPLAVGPAGETVVADAPYTKWVQGTADLRTVLGASVTAIAAQGASIFTYIREIQVANFGPSSVLVTFAGGLGSILGYSIAPAGGGSNFVTRLKTGENSAFTASINGTASVLVSAQGFIAKI